MLHLDVVRDEKTQGTATAIARVIWDGNCLSVKDAATEDLALKLESLLTAVPACSPDPAGWVADQLASSYLLVTALHDDSACPFGCSQTVRRRYEPATSVLG